MDTTTIYVKDDAADTRAANAASMYRKFRAAGWSSEVAMENCRAQFGADLTSEEIGRGVGIIGRTRS